MTTIKAGSLSDGTEEDISSESSGGSSIVTIVPEESAIENEPEQTLIPSDITAVEDTGVAASASGGCQFIVTDLTTSTSEVSPGGTIKVFATVENIGDQAGACVVLLVVNGEVETSKTVTSLAAGSKDLLQFEFTRDTPDTYKIQVGEEAISVVVAKGLNITRLVIIILAALAVIAVIFIIRFLIRLTTK
jgi:hypothetical protein